VREWVVVVVAVRGGVVRGGGRGVVVVIVGVVGEDIGRWWCLGVRERGVVVAVARARVVVVESAGWWWWWSSMRERRASIPSHAIAMNLRMKWERYYGPSDRPLRLLLAFPPNYLGSDNEQ
jgi:hypothetical protein